MAGSQFATPRPVFPSRPKRRFTLAEANRSLPLVQRIVADVVRAHETVTQLHRQLEAGSASREQESVQKDLDREVTRLQDYVDELSEVGCELKDYQVGLVDFVGRHEGRDVYLCWRLGEGQIEYWHEVHTGFAGRQSVASLHEAE